MWLLISQFRYTQKSHLKVHFMTKPTVEIKSETINKTFNILCFLQNLFGTKCLWLRHIINENDIQCLNVQGCN